MLTATAILQFITVMSGFFVVASILCYNGNDHYRFWFSFLAYALAVLVGSYSIKVFFMEWQPDAYSAAITLFLAVSTYRKGGNVACFFKGA